MAKREKKPKWLCMRKITPTRTGGRLVNLGGVLPEDWQYVDLYSFSESKDVVMVRLVVVRRETEDARYSR